MKVLIFTEGGKGMGFGHITRCTALYEAFKEKRVIPTLIVNSDSSVKNILKGRKRKVSNWLQEGNKLENLIRNANIVIIDSYLAGLDFYKKISQKINLCVYIDDNKRLNYPKGVVINGTIYANELVYPKKKNITYLLGTKYTPLRKEFWSVPQKNINKRMQNILVTFGGNDIQGMTLKAIKYLTNNFPRLHKKVIIGAGFKNIKAIEKSKDDNTVLYYCPTTNEMVKIMLDSDIAISASGQTLYELARIGVPTIAIGMAKNQIDNIKGWRKAGFIEYVGQFDDRMALDRMCRGINRFFSYEERRRSKEIGRRMMRFIGARNIIDKLIYLNEK